MKTMKSAGFILTGMVALLVAACNIGQDVSSLTWTASLPATSASAVSGFSQAQAATSRRAPGGGFADLPDQGQAVVFPARATIRREGAYTWHRVGVSEAHALAAIAGGTLRVPAPDGGMLEYAYERHVEHASGDWTWVGRLVGAPEGVQAIVTFGTDAVFGTIGQADNAPLRLTTRDGVAWMVATDRSALAATGASRLGKRPDAIPVPPEAIAEPSPAAVLQSSDTQVSSTSQQAEAEAEVETTTTVDLVLGYTSGFSTANGGASGALTRLHYLVDVSNQAYINTQVPLQVRMVHAMEVSYPDATDNEEALEELTGYESGVGDTTPDPAFAALRQARDAYGGDLVSLVRKFSEPENGSCGVAWLIGGGQQTVTTGWERFGYSVVSDGRDNGSDGLTYYCQDETLAHEAGHNMGSAHDVETAKGDDGVLDDDEYGAYPYSFGYKTPAGAGFFHTIMAYGDEEETYRVFSNPDITFCGGFACGTANADNARSLSQVAPVIAQFRATVVPEGEENAHNDVNGDDRSDLLWFKWGQIAIWYMSGYKIDATAAYTPASDLYPYVTGEFDGTAGTDIVFRDGDGTLIFWIGGATYRRSPSEYGMSFGWRLQAAGDHNADGISDLYWRSAVDGRVMYWLMDGDQKLVSYRAFSQAPAFDMVTTGDFNGDGATDLFFRRRSDGATVLWSAHGTGYAATSPGGISKYWVPVNSADYENDGDDDIVWRSEIDGRVLIWIMEDGVRASYVVFESDTTRELLGSADVNGDDRLDLVWRRDDGAVSVWLNEGASFTHRYIATRDLTWKFVRGGR